MKLQVQQDCQNPEQVIITDETDKPLLRNLEPELAEYIITACKVYESLRKHYLAIADDLAYKEKIALIPAPFLNTN